ncbi:MAG: nucleotidyltransferase domain-containing protein [Nanoarchaeota archaeon]
MDKKADRKIKNFLRKVRKKYHIDKAIFFGSRARGDNFKNSDYDIILVSSDFNGIFFSQRIANMYEFWDYYPIDIEPICYTPEEFEIKKKEIGIVREAIKEGINLI